MGPTVAVRDIRAMNGIQKYCMKQNRWATYPIQIVYGLWKKEPDCNPAHKVTWTRLATEYAIKDHSFLDYPKAGRNFY